MESLARSESKCVCRQVTSWSFINPFACSRCKFQLRSSLELICDLVSDTCQKLKVRAQRICFIAHYNRDCYARYLRHFETLFAAWFAQLEGFLLASLKVSGSSPAFPRYELLVWPAAASFHSYRSVNQIPASFGANRRFIKFRPGGSKTLIRLTLQKRYMTGGCDKPLDS